MRDEIKETASTGRKTKSAPADADLKKNFKCYNK